ncbi:DUF4403 family protein [Deinococcus arenicola]|uniref:DUF4403 family protein n=1 Tax=Deinococcus arenicola TaxID=2994950 RepID=A0ABU4DSG1_9DEIO|nr:DUF4403 family protein [Deinococcus sp. ZS9-10]MDV6375371.1 DUF4403 family protein [Deinococcus sp. ZS9-10]
MTAPTPPTASLTLPLRLPYPELSRLAAGWAAQQAFMLPLPGSPTLRVTDIQINAAGPRLNAAVSVQSSGLLGVRATLDLSGVPVLDEAGQILTLGDVALATRKEGLGGRLLGMLADARVSAYLIRLARVDLAPRLAELCAQVQGRLPLSPLDGIMVAGTVTRLAVTHLEVGADALLLTVAAGGDLQVTLSADGLLPPGGPVTR